MGRPRQFRIEDVLESAIECFSNMGYEATSIQDLINVTGIQKGSLYSTFGGKEELFIKCLRYSWDMEKAYIEEELGRTNDLVELTMQLSGHSAPVHGAEAVHAGSGQVHGDFFRLMFHSIAAGRGGMNRAPEMVEEVFEFFSEKIDVAQKSGHIRCDLEPASITRLLLWHVIGGEVMYSRFGGNEGNHETARLLCLEMFRPR